MTEAINFFQAILSFNSFSKIRANRGEIRLANALKKEARKLAEEAAQEALSAKTAQKITFEAKDENSKRNFAEIALWHSLVAFGKYRQAAKSFEEAAELETGKKREFIKNARKMNEMAVNFENSVSNLSEYLNEVQSNG